MGGLNLLEEARAAGLRVWVEGERLRVKGPRAASRVVQRLLAEKAQVVAALGAEPWPPRPEELACWPVELRRRWGERANALEAEGVSWREAERCAFAEIKGEGEGRGGLGGSLALPGGGETKKPLVSQGFPSQRG